MLFTGALLYLMPVCFFIAFREGALVGQKEEFIHSFSLFVLKIL